MIDAETVNMVGCKGDEASEVDEQSSADGKHHRIKIKICAAQHAKAAAADAIRKARDEVARDKGIPDDVRAKVLKSLDAEIARAEKDKG